MTTRALAHADAATPTILVSDPRGLALRTAQFHRRQAADALETRVTHQRYDAAGRAVASRDPRLFTLAQTDASVPANLNQVFSLSGVPLATQSVDAGWRLALPGEAGQAVERWDGRGSHSLTEYDELLRPIAVHESIREVAEHALERFTYAGADEDAATHNLCGQLIRHDGPAGTLHLLDLSLGGAPLQQRRHFLHSLDAPDWPIDVAERDALLETVDGATTWNDYAPTSEPQSQTDALGNRQAFAYTVAGELKNTRLTLAGDGQIEKVLVSDIRYTPFGQVDAETAGNGVITRHHYDPANSRLTGLSAHKADGTPLQNLTYTYDPVGNVRSIEDTAQSIRYFNNQRIEPIKTYRYDTLYQLIEATGWEANTGRGGPALPDLQPLPPDPSQIANYTQTYRYDPAGNLLDLVHVGAQAHGRTLTRARYSNRCLPERDDRPPTEDELAAGFDANGNLRELQPGQLLNWDLRNQLQEVRPVVREDAEDDSERYIYDGGGQRVRKVRTSQTNARTLISEVRYLPGLEIRSHSGTGEILHVISATAGSNSVQVLHWAAKPPDDILNDQVRYSLNDHLKSSTMELDQQADLISQESYYPFGGTAWWAGRSATEAKYKTVRYSGKERDATGLYYYGFRYYAPWLQRWINPDPAGYVDGMNLYQFVGANPVNNIDSVGLDKKRWQDLIHKHLLTGYGHILRGHHLDYIGEQIKEDAPRPSAGPWQYKGVRYYNQQQRAERLMPHTIAGGAIRGVDGEPANYSEGPITSSMKWIKSNGYLGYVLALNEQNVPELAVFVPERSRRHHSSPFSGRPVLDAGMMVITSGAVAFIENKSGHYRPRIEQKLHTLNLLKKAGMNLKDIFVSERIPDEFKTTELPPQAYQEEFESYLDNNLYNAADLYNWYMDTASRHESLSNNDIAKKTARAERPPLAHLPSKGKDGLTRLETLTYRNWEQRDKNGRPGRLLKNSHLGYK
ncbi:RHS repeat-associated core domain-containing protein [Pseudomonas brassicacearum]|uniref:RHS repeat-associated core domain-containing protein n=1 Tax=Pseudomonas brassicacearum TaxID=930166 RepID=UPI000F492B3F|nr:RHS repeat-associated core domain-containing protein [Pseudomonas brassicacearum]